MAENFTHLMSEMKISQSPRQIESSNRLVESLLSCTSAEKGLKKPKGQKTQTEPKNKTNPKDKQTNKKNPKETQKKNQTQK